VGKINTRLAASLAWHRDFNQEGMENRVLIVDDDFDLLYVLSLYIEKKGYATVSLSSIEETLGFIKEHKPLLILLDNQLEDGFGINVVATIKRMSPDSWVVLMSADEQSSLSEDVNFKEVDAFLAKPFKPEMINEVLGRVAA
jgi:DNA-binding NtrC family response regulator